MIDIHGWNFIFILLLLLLILKVVFVSLSQVLDALHRDVIVLAVRLVTLVLGLLWLLFLGWRILLEDLLSLLGLRHFLFLLKVLCLVLHAGVILLFVCVLDLVGGEVTLNLLGLIINLVGLILRSILVDFRLLLLRIFVLLHLWIGHLLLF